MSWDHGIFQPWMKMMASFSASAFSVIWWSWTPLSSEACVSFCAWWHCDNQILIFYLQNHHSECICWPNFLYPLHSPDCCVHSLSFISPPPKAIHLFLPPLFLFFTLVSLPPHSSQIKSDWQYFTSFQVYSIARQYFCTWHGTIKKHLKINSSPNTSWP